MESTLQKNPLKKQNVVPYKYRISECEIFFICPVQNIDIYTANMCNAQCYFSAHLGILESAQEYGIPFNVKKF